MARIELFLISVLSDLARSLREMNVGFCVVGALVPELLLDTTPRRMTGTVVNILRPRLKAAAMGRFSCSRTVVAPVL